ncbi:MAG: PrsW family glutamic-type intramembrane protease, partial [Phycisphaerae bacterium]
RTLSHAKPDDPEHLAATAQGVYDEPDILPGRAAETVTTDWTCDACGYNLRGLPAGHRCPECGHVELYRPPPPDAASYQRWFRSRWETTPASKGWLIAAAVALVGGPFAIFAALLESATGGGTLLGALPIIAVFGPAAEEVLKIGAVLLVVETRPYLFRRVEQLQTATLLSSIIFAVIENVIYLNIYVSQPSIHLAMWRWTVCVALHIGCTLIATRGLVLIWTNAVAQFRKPRVSDGLPMLVWAIVIHGCYNVAVAIAGYTLGPLW